MVIKTSILEPRDLGGILGETFRIYRRNFLRLIAIVAIVQGILGILGVVLVSVFVLPVVMTEGGIESVAPFVVAMIILVVVSIVAYALMEGALIHAISEQNLRQTVSIGRAYRFAWGRLGAMIGAEILAGLAILGMSITIVGIPFAIYFGVRWAFIWQAALLEGAGPRAALSRSSDVVGGDWWRVVGITFVVGIIAGAISVILGIIPIVGSIVGSILATSIAIAAATLLYYDLRVRKEGYSVETLAQELDIQVGSDAA